MAPTHMLGNVTLGNAGDTGFEHFIEHQFRIQQIQAAAPKNGQCAVRRHLFDGLLVIEIISKLSCVWIGFILARRQLALKVAGIPQPFPHGIQQHGIFGPLFAQNIAYTIENGSGGTEVRVALGAFAHQVGGRCGVGVEGGVSKELCGKWEQASLDGHLPFRPAPWFVR